MCIICAKPSGVAMPSNKIIKNMWEGNSDGAGIMWTSNNKVHIKKGFMKYGEFKRFINKMKKYYDLTKIPLVMHFRITTHGGTKPQNCHPFPVTSKIKKLQTLELSTDLGVAHNGTITIDNPPEISDTMAYIATKMTRMRTKNGAFYRNEKMRNKIKKEITSKMCFLDNKGDLYFIGDFVEEDGVFYSNTSYLGWKRWWNYGSYGGYGDYGNGKYSSSYYRSHNDYWFDDDWEYEDGYADYAKMYENEQKRKEADRETIFSTYQKKNLMEIEGYIYEGGEMIEGIIFIDEQQHAYLYDEVEDVCEPKSGTVYSFNGIPPKYNEDLAIPISVRIRHKSTEAMLSERSAI